MLIKHTSNTIIFPHVFNIEHYCLFHAVPILIFNSENWIGKPYFMPYKDSGSHDEITSVNCHSSGTIRTLCFVLFTLNCVQLTMSRILFTLSWVQHALSCVLFTLSCVLLTRSSILSNISSILFTSDWITSRSTNSIFLSNRDLFYKRH